jgi:hypothetical protein
MKFGAEDKKKVYALSILGVIAAIAVYSTFFSGDSGPSPAPAPGLVTERNRAVEPINPPTNPPTPMPGTAPGVSQSTRRPLLAGRSSSRNDEFHPSLKPKREEDRVDPRTVDPTLHLAKLARVQDVKLDGGQRNLFQFGAAAPVAKLEGPEIKVVPKPVRVAMGPPQYKPPPPPPPVTEPPPPPFTPKYYGLATKQIDGKKTAFFLDGEEIILATEGMTVKKRFKLMRIAANSVVVQDVESKKEQTVQISEDAGASAQGE